MNSIVRKNILFTQNVDILADILLRKKDGKEFGK